MDFKFKNIKETIEKYSVMKECDDAFTISVINRPTFDMIFKKIDENAVFIGAYTNEGEIAGYSTFYANDYYEGNAFLTLFCVKKEMQRMHLGTLLMQKSIDEAKRRGMKMMGLEVLKHDTGAIKFYKSQMFVKCNERSNGSFYNMHRVL